MNIKKILRLVVSIPKTIYVNFKGLPFNQAKRIPLVIDYNTKIIGIRKNSIKISGECKFAMVKFGIQEGTIGVPDAYKRQYLVINDEGEIVFKGKAQFARGISLTVGKKGCIIFGDNFTCNKGCFIACADSITFGDNFLMGWNSSIRDMDGHHIWVREKTDEMKKESTKPIIIGENVWVAACVDILKGSIIPDGCVIAYRSCVFKQFSGARNLIGGYPAKVLQEDIYWE